MTASAKISDIQAVVVWRYPGTAEVESLRLFYPHVDRLYIVDNSEGDYHALVSGLDKVTYLPQHQNTGIAKALNIGCEQAVKNGAQWILTMDQDSRWDQQNVIEYIDEVSQYPHIGQVGIFSPMHDIYPPHVKRHAHHTDRFEPRHAVMCSGNLLRATAWLQTGGFREDFFIDLVDDEICCHLHALGWNIIRANHIHLSHQLGEGVHFSPILRHPFFVHEPWRYYHIAQNTRRMITLYPDMAWFYRREIGKHLKHLLLYDRDRKGKKLYQFLRGLILDV